MLSPKGAFALNPSPSTFPYVATETTTASVYHETLWPLQLQLMSATTSATLCPIRQHHFDRFASILKRQLARK